jgi:hypothetical protein
MIHVPLPSMVQTGTPLDVRLEVSHAEPVSDANGVIAASCCLGVALVAFEFTKEPPITYGPRETAADDLSIGRPPVGGRLRNAWRALMGASATTAAGKG